MNVLLYQGRGISQPSLEATRSHLRRLLGSSHDVILAGSTVLASEPWTQSTSLLVFPGGRDSSFMVDLDQRAIDRITGWVQEGGSYLGICAGAYFASNRVDFELPAEPAVSGNRPLRLFPGTCKGPAFPGFSYGHDDLSRPVSLSINQPAWGAAWKSPPSRIVAHCSGGGVFHLDSEKSDTVDILATYTELGDQFPAGVLCKNGRGSALLWAVHPEMPVVSNSEFELMAASLRLLGFSVAPNGDVPQPTLTPMLLVSSSGRLVTAVDEALRTLGKFDPKNDTLNDSHDTFRLLKCENASEAFARAADRPVVESPDDLRALEKEVVVCHSGLPGSQLTPRFDVAEYYRSLQISAVRQSNGAIHFGELLIYGEVMTSSQTILERNPSWTSALPSGSTVVASHQLSGRGRRTNGWISSAGCLQFSLLLRVGKELASQLVFVQYLFALAVVESILSMEQYEKLDLRLKWPNDIYANIGRGNRVEGKSAKEADWRKIGGILVNTSFDGSNFTIIVGCGLNVRNPRPTVSLADLIDAFNEQNGTRLPLLREETVLGRILARFEKAWQIFSSTASFKPFLGDYLRRWLQSDQVVTLADTGKQVRIVGITEDYGFLRTVPLENPDAPAIILSPDGNSFDMLHNLIRRVE